jgi:Tfp pilus assembly protein PilV
MPMAPVMRSDERGFTLIEVLVAATLFIAGVLATLTLIDSATKTTAVSKQRDVANAVAQEMVERATGGRYTSDNNDLTDVVPASLTPGPADRLRAGMDPDGDQAGTAVTPATVISGTVPVNAAQSWSLRRKNTAYTVSYRACTASDPYQSVLIAGPFDCDSPNTTGGPGGGNETTTPEGCKLGVIDPGDVDPADPGDLTVKLQVLGIAGLSACVGAASAPLSAALCTLLGSSPSLTDLLVGTNGVLAGALGGIAGSSVGLCSSPQVEQISKGAQEGMASSTRLAVTVAWTDLEGRAHSIARTSLVRRPKADA